MQETYTNCSTESLHSGREKLPRTPIMIQYEVLPSSVKENEDKNHVKSADINQNCFFDSLQAYEVCYSILLTIF